MYKYIQTEVGNMATESLTNMSKILSIKRKLKMPLKFRNKLSWAEEESCDSGILDFPGLLLVIHIYNSFLLHCYDVVLQVIMIIWINICK